MPSIYSIRALLISTLLCCLPLAQAQTSAPANDVAAVSAAVRGFHEAMSRGDANGVLRLLAADAVILEEGHSETRDQYRHHHLAADIEFAQALPARRSAVHVVVHGDTAWASSTSVTQGTFRGRAVHSNGAELMVLTRGTAGWEIRAVHWSSRAVRAAS